MKQKRKRKRKRRSSAYAPHFRGTRMLVFAAMSGTTQWYARLPKGVVVLVTRFGSDITWGTSGPVRLSSKPGWYGTPQDAANDADRALVDLAKAIG